MEQRGLLDCWKTGWKESRHDKKGTSKKKRQGGIGIFALFIGLLVFLAAAAGLFYAFDKNKPEDLSDESVKLFDLTDRSKTAHKTIDDILLQKRSIGSCAI